MADADTAEALAAWAASVRWEDVSEADRGLVVDALVDTVGVALAGMAQSELDGVLAAAERLGLLGAGPAEIWGSTTSVAPGAAALLNATAGHLLDFDDVHYLLHGHPSTVLWPALVAVAQAEGLPARALLEGYVAGLGAMAGVSVMFGPRHYSNGWHSTATIGTIGAAAGVATALGLGPDGVLAAMGAGASMASGIRANFGTVLKPFHAGLAARGAVEAAVLAASGVLASRNALAGPLGAVAVFGDRSWPGEGAPEAPVLAAASRATSELGLKLYPACRGAHYAIDAALDVRTSLGDAVGDVEHVHVVVPLGSRTALLYDDPETALQAKFSLPYSVATTLAHGIPTFAHYTEESIVDPRTRALMATMTVVEDTSRGDLSASMEGRYAYVEARTSTGETVSAITRDVRGSAERPLLPEEVDTKFLDAAGLVLDADAAMALLVSLRALGGRLDDGRGLPGLLAGPLDMSPLSGIRHGLFRRRSAASLYL